MSLKIIPAVLVSLCSVAYSAQDKNGSDNFSHENVDLVSLENEARNNKYVHVLIDMNVMNSIHDLQKNPKINFEIEQEELLESIKGYYVEGAVWKGSLGQLSVYVNNVGLEKLSKNPLVRALVPANDSGMIYDPYGDIEKIKREIISNGIAIVSVIPASSIDGEMKGRALGSSDPMQRKREFIKSLHAENFGKLWMDGARSINGELSSSAESQFINLEVKIEGLYELKNRKDIRSIRLINKKYMRLDSDINGLGIHLDPAAIDEAELSGHAAIIIHLKRYPGYTPISGILTPEEKKSQAEEIRKIFSEIVEKVEPGATERLQIVEGIASAAIELKLESILRLYKNPDYRIEKIDFSKPIGELSLNTSTAGGVGGTNAQYIWQYTRGASQWIAVIDSGVQSMHPIFNNKTILQACYGTNNANHYTTCPVPDANGDTLPDTFFGAAEPCGFLAHPTPNFPTNHICAHGTHVAGIAAGRGGQHPQGGILNGVAIDSNIVAINAISRQRSNPNSGVVYDIDLVKGLDYIRQLRVTRLYELTVNLSISGLSSLASAYQNNCNEVNPQVSDLVADLKSRGVAVVASTGNNGIRGGIGYPSCISGVVKVGSINKYTGLFSNFTNINNPIMYSGHFFLAPGGGIASAVPTGQYGVADGTSMAAPHIAGAIALIKAVAPNATVDDVNNFIAAKHSVPKEIILSPGNSVIVRSLKFS